MTKRISVALAILLVWACATYVALAQSSIATNFAGNSSTAPIFPNGLDVLVTGVRLTGADGVLTMLGLGNGNDESVTVDLDNAAANAIALASGTGANNITWTGAITAAGDVEGTTVTVNGGAPITNVLSATASLDFDLSGSGVTCQDLTITVTGAVGDDDTVLIGMAGSLGSTAGVQITGFVSATNTVTVRACDVTAGNPDPTAQTVRATVVQF